MPHEVVSQKPSTNTSASKSWSSWLYQNLSYGIHYGAKTTLTAVSKLSNFASSNSGTLTAFGLLAGAAGVMAAAATGDSKSSSSSLVVAGTGAVANSATNIPAELAQAIAASKAAANAASVSNIQRTNSSRAKRDTSQPGESGEVQINTTYQYDQQNPASARKQDGTYVVVLECENADGTVDIRRQLLSSSGAQLGDDVVIAPNDFAQSGLRRFPTVVVLPNGTYWIIWQSLGEDGDGWGIFGQQFAADDSPIGFRQVAFNNLTAGDQINPTAATTATEVLVAWTDLGTTPSSNKYITFPVGGSPSGSESSITSPQFPSSDPAFAIAVAALANNQFVAVYNLNATNIIGVMQFITPPSSLSNAYRLDPLGTQSNQWSPYPIPTPTSVVVAWNSEAPAGNKLVYENEFAYTGNPVASAIPTQVSPDTGEDQLFPAGINFQPGIDGSPSNTVFIWSSYSNETFFDLGSQLLGIGNFVKLNVLMALDSQVSLVPLLPYPAVYQYTRAPAPCLVMAANNKDIMVFYTGGGAQDLSGNGIFMRYLSPKFTMVVTNAQLFFTENQAFQFPPYAVQLIQFFNPDGTLTVSLVSPTDGTLELRNSTGVSFNYNSATGTGVLSGTFSDITNAVGNLIFNAAAYFFQNVPVNFIGHNGVDPDETATLILNAIKVYYPLVIDPTAIVPQQIFLGSTDYSGQIANSLFTDLNRGILTYSISGAPPWLNFNPQTLQFSGSPTLADIGAYQVSLSADNGEPNGKATVNIPMSVSSSLSVEPEENLITNYVYIEEQPLKLNQTFAISSNATSVTMTIKIDSPSGGQILPNTSTSGLQITFNQDTGVWTASGAPTALSQFLEPEPLTYNPPPLTYSPRRFYTIIDDGVNPPITGRAYLSGIHVNHAPLVVGFISNITVAQNVSFTVPINGTFIDPDGDPLVYTVNQVDGSPLPTCIQFVNITLFGQCDTPGETDIKVTAEDPYNATASTEFKLTVLSQQPTNNSNSNSRKIIIPVAIIAGSAACAGVIGFFAWRRNVGANKLATERQDLNPLAAAVRDKLKLSGVDDFRSAAGDAYVKEIVSLHDQLGMRANASIDQCGQAIADVIKEKKYLKPGLLSNTLPPGTISENKATIAEQVKSRLPDQFDQVAYSAL